MDVRTACFAGRKKFVSSVVDGLLSSHPHRGVRNAVVPLLWYQFSCTHLAGITWTGKGAPIAWNTLTVEQRRQGVLELWTALANLHEHANVAHADIKKENIIQHDGVRKFIDFDKAYIVSPEAKPALNFDTSHGLTYCPPLEAAASMNTGSDSTGLNTGLNINLPG